MSAGSHWRRTAVFAHRAWDLCTTSRLPVLLVAAATVASGLLTVGEGRPPFTLHIALNLAGVILAPVSPRPRGSPRLGPYFLAGLGLSLYIWAAYAAGGTFGSLEEEAHAVLVALGLILAAHLLVSYLSLERAPQARDTTPATDRPRPVDLGQVRPRIFIGHGRSRLWRELKDYLEHELKLSVIEFNRVPTAGVATVERLEHLLDQSAFAFLVLTGEDPRQDGAKHARENVVHEAGLFQGRLGFRRAIVLLEEGCTEFSNIHGLGQIRFPREDIAARFHEVRGVLEREGFVSGVGSAPAAHTLAGSESPPG